jgi:hypothetical protein
MSAVQAAIKFGASVFGIASAGITVLISFNVAYQGLKD